MILNNELLLMQELRFHLTVHNPYRALEGLLIDIKTRINLDVESWRSEIDQFLGRVYLTNSILIYSPSQIALAAIIHTASKLQENVDKVVMYLFPGIFAVFNAIYWPYYTFFIYWTYL